MKDQADLIIKKLEPGELPEVVEIENLSFQSPWSAGQFKQNIDHFIVAVLNRRVVGFIGIEMVADEAHINHTAVHPDFRRIGIGKKLVGRALKYPANKFILEVRKSNTAAKNLYKQFGFKEISQRKNYYSDNNEDAIIMIHEK